MSSATAKYIVKTSSCPGFVTAGSRLHGLGRIGGEEMKIIVISRVKFCLQREKNTSLMQA
ncbi:MAG: hypothetical protein ABL891_13685 [Burkholderiales bacterium]